MLGQSIEIQGRVFSVLEAGESICEGGQGQLPFRILSGERIRYIDLGDAQGRRATIEVSPDGKATVFLGASLESQDLVLDPGGDPRSSEPLATQQGSGTRERVRYDPSRMVVIRCKQCGASNEDIDLSDKTSRCVQCDAPLDLPSSAHTCPCCSAQIQCWTPGAKTAACPECGSAIGIEADGLNILAELKKADRARRSHFRLPINLGDKAKFNGDIFILVGYIRFKETDEDGSYITDEFLLYNERWGYRWLIRYDHHWALQSKVDQVPQINPHVLMRSKHKKRFSALGRSWRLYEHGSGEIEWVEGELPWVAKQGDRSSYVESIAPPYLLVCELSSNEIEWSVYEYLEVKDLAAAFGRDPSSFESPRGLFSCQPNPKPIYHGSAAVVCFAFLAFSVLSQSAIQGEQVASFEIDSQTYKNEFLTDPFVLSQDMGLSRIEFSSPVDNSWVYLDWALVSEADEAKIESAANISYYHGYDGAESWSEGDRTESHYVKVPSGEYRFLLLGSAGHGESAVDVDQGASVTIKVFENARLLYLFKAFLFVGNILTSYHVVRAHGAYSQRWRHLQDD